MSASTTNVGTFRRNHILDPTPGIVSEMMPGLAYLEGLMAVWVHFVIIREKLMLY